MENKIVDVAKRTLLKDVEIDFRLLGGMSNYTYVVKGLENDDSKYTVRIPGAFDTYFVSVVQIQINYSLLNRWTDSKVVM